MHSRTLENTSCHVHIGHGRLTDLVRVGARITAGFGSPLHKMLMPSRMVIN